MARPRLSAEEIRTIRMSPLKDADIAKQYGVSHVSIWNIRNGKTYKWVDGNGKARPGREGKLAEDQVRFIRQRPLDRDVLAERFGLSTDMIGRIQRGEVYTWVTE